MAAYFWVFLVLAGFGAFHGLSARARVQATLRARANISAPAYTGLRAVVSFGLLVFSVVVLFHWADGTRLLFEPLTGTPAILPALVTFWIAGRALSQVAKAERLPQFFGFQDTPKIFIFTGAFTLCRHPMYAGWLIASWGLLLSKPFLLTVFYNLLLTAFVVFLALQEERRMIELFGDRYRAYQKQIPFILPYGFLKPQIRNTGGPKL